ncbi:MAG: cupin domain-containing protein [Prolixibacteraceae bacterium]|nr:cupin domain-containing protein [Prolixibacteraceae bacterium]MBN2774615.1 cupin domain-containing protein [Prolixibacteraceae bacterium]
MGNASFYIKKLRLEKHPEGGWFREIYRAEEITEKHALPGRYSSARNYSTSIYYLLEGEDKSMFHRIKSDEIWHFYTGSSSVEILLILDGKIKKLHLGSDIEKQETFQVIIPKNTWFTAHLINKQGYSLIGCTVAPGFDFDDFELATRGQLLIEFPHLETVIKDFTT